MIEEMSTNNYDDFEIIESFNRNRFFLLKSKLHKGKAIDDFYQHKISSLLDNTLLNSLKERIQYPYKFDTKKIKDTVILYVEIERSNTIYRSKKNIIQFYNRSIYGIYVSNCITNVYTCSSFHASTNQTLTKYYESC